MSLDIRSTPPPRIHLVQLNKVLYGGLTSLDSDTFYNLVHCIAPSSFGILVGMELGQESYIPKQEKAITALPAALMSNNKAVAQVQVNGPFLAPSDFPEEDPAVAKDYFKELVTGDGLKLNLVSVVQHPCFEVKQDKVDAGFPHRPGHRIDISSAQHNRKVVFNYFSNPYLVSALFVAELQPNLLVVFIINPATPSPHQHVPP